MSLWGCDNMGRLLVRGMLAGLIASMLAFGFAKVFGEPQVERAIAFEEQLARAAGEPAEDEVFSREVQASVGLLTGIAVYGMALGGLFALAYAFISGRVIHLPARSTALILAAVGFLALYFVPHLKYPANPPAVGLSETIGYRTQLYFGMIVFSLAALAIAVSFGWQLLARLGAWNASIVGALIYLTLIAIAAYALPAIDEVPETFPADLLWRFRVAAVGTQAILWTSIGILFGLLLENGRKRPTH